MRENGIALSKRRREDFIRAPADGELSMRQTTHEQLHRTSLTAKLDCGAYSIYLLDAHLLWIEGTRFAIAGFEQRNTELGTVEYAQTWIVETLVT